MTITASWRDGPGFGWTVLVEWRDITGAGQFTVKGHDLSVTLKQDGVALASVLRSPSWIRRIFAGGFPYQCVSATGEYLGTIAAFDTIELDGIRYDIGGFNYKSHRCEVAEVERTIKTTVVKPLISGHHLFFCVMCAFFYMYDNRVH